MRNIFCILILAVSGAASGQPTLHPSSEHIYLRVGDTENVTFLWNRTHDTSVSVRSKLPHIASLTQGEGHVQVRGHRLGHTSLVAHLNRSHHLRLEEGLVQVTVLQFHWVQTLSVFCGWVYFTVWTLSFYPQIFSNFRRNSVVGLNFDFLALNELGYVCYSIFNSCLFFIPSIQEDYFQRHAGATNPVLLNDVLFSLHGFFATTIMIGQTFLYDRGGQTMSNTGLALLTSGVCSLVAILLSAALGTLSWLDAVLCVSLIKLAVTMVKYIPQALMNFRNKSTTGWSIECMMCDLTGSCFSILQMVLNSYNCDDWSSIVGDPTKFGLGLVSIAFDILFMVQHFILYRQTEETKSKMEQKSFYKNLRDSLLNKALRTKR